MEDFNVKEFGVYLIKYKYSSSKEVFKIKILEITQTCYKLKYESNETSWTTIHDFNSTYRIIEELKNYNICKIINEIIDANGISKCPHCGGSGYVPNISSTAGKVLCPHCWGGGSNL